MQISIRLTHPGGLSGVGDEDVSEGDVGPSLEGGHVAGGVLGVRPEQRARVAGLLRGTCTSHTS